MSTERIPAVYMRGGTSRALIFHERDLPPATSDSGYAAWSPIFLKAIGSPDPNGRQLDGMGGGISSLSKVAIVGPPSHPQADVDYTFGQVSVTDADVGYRGNCGNISSAIGPFAIDEGLVAAADGLTTVRIHNTNTGKIILAEFEVSGGNAKSDGDYVLQGVAGTGAPIKLTFLDPGGATTGALLPTGNARDRLCLSNGFELEVSLVDAANPVCFFSEEAVPKDLSADWLVETRLAAAVAMGLSPDYSTARHTLKNLPLLAMVKAHAGTDADIAVRMVSSDQFHKATPLTGAMCLAAAVAIPNTLPAAIALTSGGEIRIAHPSGVLAVGAASAVGGDVVDRVWAYRTARRIMEGRVVL